MTAADSTYHTYDVGVHDLKAGMYFWVAPMNNPDVVEGIWVDRIVLIRDTATRD